MISSRRSDRSPLFVVAPSRCLPPVDCCRGARPGQAAKSRALRTVSGGGARTSPFSVAMAYAGRPPFGSPAMAISRAAFDAPCGTICPNTVRWPRRALIAGVRCPISSSRRQKTIAAPWVSSLFTGPKRIAGRPAASQIASASAASCCGRFTKGLTSAGGMRRTSWPGFPISRPQKRAPPPASIATPQRGTWLQNAST